MAQEQVLFFSASTTILYYSAKVALRGTEVIQHISVDRIFFCVLAHRDDDDDDDAERRRLERGPKISLLTNTRTYTQCRYGTIPVVVLVVSGLRDQNLALVAFYTVPGCSSFLNFVAWLARKESSLVDHDDYR